MDKVLILDGNAGYGQSLKSDLVKSHQFQVEVATTGKDAIEMLESTKIAVLVTELTLPDTDAFDLLVYMTRRHPSKPCIITADRDKYQLKEKVVQREFFSVLEKPFEVGELLSAIFIALNLRDEGMNLKGMNMASIIPLIEVLKKSCFIEIKSNISGTGYLYYKNGVLAEAYCKDLKDQNACTEITSWKSIIIRMMDEKEWQTIIPKQKPLTQNDLAAQKKPAPAESVKDPLSYLFNKRLRDFKDITGFLALAVFNQKNEMIASDQSDPNLNLQNIAGKMKSLLSSADNSFGKMNFGAGNSFTFHMARCTILIVTDSLAPGSGLYMIGVTKQYGNWTYFKTLMRKLLNELKQ